MSEPAFANQVEVTSPLIQDGLRADHPRLRDGIRDMLKLNKKNEDICRVIGVPQELVDKERAKLKKS